MLVLGAAFAVALAGCSGPAVDAKSPGPAGLGGDDLGEISVLVTDEELLPLQGARVALVGSDVANFTGSDGKVRLAVAPGSHRVHVESYGHEAAFRDVDVVAGGVSELVVALVALPAQVPFFEVAVFSGLSSCTVPLLWGIFDFAEVCSSASVAKASDMYALEPSDEWAFVVQELAWEGSHWFTMFTDNASASTVVLKHLSIRHGPSPLRVAAFPGQIAMGHDPQYFEPYPAKDLALRIRGMFAGYFGEAFEPISGACNVGHDSGCMGVGTSVESRFSLFVSVFYHQPPGDVGVYSALPDQ